MSSPNPKSKRAARLVLAALSDIQAQSKSATIRDIAKFIVDEYDIPANDFKRFLPGTIERGLAFGAIRRIRGKYSLGEAFLPLSNRHVFKWKRIARPNTLKRMKLKCLAY